MSKLKELKAGEAFKLAAIDVPGFAVSETNADNYLLVFEGHAKRSAFIQIPKRVLVELCELMRTEFT